MSFALYAPSVYEFIFALRKGCTLALHFIFKLRHHTRIIRFTALCFLWILCLIVGTLIASNLPQISSELLDAAMWRSPSWVMVLIVTGLPLLLCFAAIWHGWFSLNCVLVALEGICRGFCGFWIFLSYGSGAWLIRLGFLFSSAAGAVLLWRLIFKYSLVGVVSLKKDIYITAFLLTLFTLVDTLLVSPFMVRLSMYF